MVETKRPGPVTRREPRCALVRLVTIHDARLWAPLEMESPRLLLRVPAPEFAEAVIEAIRESFEELHQWMAWAREIPDLATERTHLEGVRRHMVAGESLDYFLFRRSDQRLLGACGFPRIDRPAGCYEIGYWIRSSDTGHGYAREAVHRCAVLAFASLGAERVEIRMSDRNERSWRVAEAAGFRFESLLPNDGTHPDGSPRDSRVYALTDAPAGPSAR